MDLHRLLRSLALLVFILATYFSNTEARQHRHKHGRQRDKRQEDYGYYVYSGGNGPDRGPWGPWGTESPCSRSCGGGVSQQTRTCMGGFCEGPTKRFYSCNIQDCPEGSEDFRSEQCAAFNTIPFEDVYYDWVPYTKAPNKCELNCMPRGDRFFYRQNDTVIDGTRCDDEKLDICVEGKCLPVGCDMILGSPAREDKCRTCGGDSSDCNTSSGVIDSQDFVKGYNDLLLIPAGATNVLIRERKASNNYLAVRNTTGHYYLNGNWRIDYPRPLRFAGTIFHYEQIPYQYFSPESISCLGPTTEDLYISILYQERNPGISYEYSISKGRVQDPETDSYTWVTGEFGPCSATCGGGIQERKIWCAKKGDTSEVTSDLCDSGRMPAIEKTCNTEPCPPQWSPGQWEQCSKTCGPGGVKTRQVICEQIISNGRPSLVNNSLCEQLYGPAPPTKEECPDIPCPKWHIGPWLPCDKLCGDGKQRRQVHCFEKVDGRIKVLGDSACPDAKPETELPCTLKPCEGLDWIVSEWSGCSDKCGTGSETREAFCATQKGTVYPDKFCQKNKMPVLVQECADLQPCAHEWFATQWSECSAECGSGVQTRKVFCGTFEGESIKKVEDSLCDIEKKYEDTKNCTGKEVCKGSWFTGPWSACSKPCGGGRMERKVLCLLENKTVDVTNCDANFISFSSEPCNNHPCTPDEIVPVEPTQSINESDQTDEEDNIDDEVEEFCEDYDYDDSHSLFDNDPDGSALSALKVSEKEFDKVEAITFSSTGNSRETSSDDSSLSTDFSSSLGSSSFDEDLMMSDSTYSPLETDGSSSISEGSTEENPSFSSEGSSVSTSETTDISSTSTESSTYSSSPSTTDSSVSTEMSTILETITSYFTTSPFTEDFTSSSVDTTSDETETSDISETTASLAETTNEVMSSSETSPTDISSSEPSTTFISTDSTVSSSSESTSEASTSSSSDSSTESSSQASSASSSDSSTESSSQASSASSSESTSEIASTEITDELTSMSETYESTSESTIPSSTVDISSSSIEMSSSTETSTIISSSSSESSSEYSSEPSTLITETLITETEYFNSTEISTVETSTPIESTLSTEETTSSATSLSSTESEYTSSISTESSSVGSSSPTVTDSSVSSSSVSYSTDIWSTSLRPTRKPKKCRRRKNKPKSKEPKCLSSEFGCCSDNETAAQGPFSKGCPQPTTCNETKYGCCPDGVSPALGKNDEGCPPSHCNETLFGCCPDGVTIAEGNDNEGCPEETTQPLDCKTTEFGCCPDANTPALGPDNSGCMIPTCESPEDCDNCTISKFGCCPDGLTPASGPDNAGCEQVTTELILESSSLPDECENFTFGCCPDGITPALGEHFEGCDKNDTVETMDCSNSTYGCCPDGISSASGPDGEGCPASCFNERFGCCDDNITLAHGPNKEGCCLNTPYGCCPDNILSASGPNLEGCGCIYSIYGCCPDNVTSARGPKYDGCGCQYTEHGCCPNKQTPATGPNYEGCPCHTHQFGCCPDGVNRAKGPYLQGCGCENTEFGCCPDKITPAPGPERKCTCEASEFGCCPDGVAEAGGEHFEGCSEIPMTTGEVCSLPKDRGPCREFTVKWFYDTEYGGCARFWYGGCGGNENRFVSKEECTSRCDEVKGRDACTLPKIAGPCEGYYPRWYYDSERKQCGQFIYKGCLGNANKFETQEECHDLCVKPDTLDPCDQEVDTGVCKGSFARWYYDKSTMACQEFTYGGCKPNGNNFLAEMACQNKCTQPGISRDECALPKTEGSCAEKIPKWYFNPTENRCMPFYYTGCEGNGNSFDTLEYCEHACPSRIEPDICSLPVVTGECHNYTQQWFYNVYDARCTPFYYGGCGGNQNRFNTENDCQRQCDQNFAIAQTPPPPVFTKDQCFLRSDAGSCSQNEPLWYYDFDTGECSQFTYGGCEGNANRFHSKEECEQLCGEVQDICSFPKAIGNCNGNYQSWFYDTSTDSCHEFEYSGCQGNKNRFNSITECEQKCRKSPPPVPGIPEPRTTQKSDVCYAPVDSGPCRAQIPKWYFNYDTQRCQLFVYGGCKGNANRFDSEEQCERHCGTFVNTDVCRMTLDNGPCLKNLRKWYFDEISNSCQEFNYGGCDGSGNRFSSLEECAAVCIYKEELFPTNETYLSHLAICKLPIDSGPCRDQSHRRWYFNEEHRRCEEFVYGGCAGNLNRFTSYQTCADFCEGLAGSNEIDNEECKDIEFSCSKPLQCPYGVERWVDERNCDNCRCNDPCLRIQCPSDTSCVVLATKNNSTGDTEYQEFCKPATKFGECPPIPSIAPEQCSQQCSNDTDCSGDLKCCYDGCTLTCLSPVASTTSPPLTAPVTLAPPDTDNKVVGASPPVIEETEPKVEAEEGFMVSMRCFARGTPTPVITWYKEDKKLAVTEGRYRFLDDGTMQIIGLYRSDAGVYVCVANNSVGPPIRKEFVLIVKDPIDRPATIIGDQNTDVVVTLGSPITLRCYSYGWPVPLIYWWKDNVTLSYRLSDEFEQLRDNSLVLKSVSVNSLGHYFCHAYNGIGSAASWKITLKAFSPVYQDPNDITSNPYLITLPRIPSAVDTPSQPLPPPYGQPVLLSTTESPVVETPKIYVVPVKTNFSLEKTVFEVGSTISIHCNVDGYPLPHVTWYKDDVPLLDNIEKNRIYITEGNRLIIEKSTVNDRGTYKCHAANDYSSDDSSVFIDVQGVYVDPRCTDNPFFANCSLIVTGKFCTHLYYAKFCCKSCTEAGQLPPYGPHLNTEADPISRTNNLLRRRRSLVIPRH